MSWCLRVLGLHRSLSVAHSHTQPPFGGASLVGGKQGFPRDTEVEGGGALDQPRKRSEIPAILRSVDPLKGSLFVATSRGQSAGRTAGWTVFWVLGWTPSTSSPGGPRLGLHPSLTPSRPTPTPPHTLVPSFLWGPRPQWPPGPSPSLGCPGASQTKHSIESMSTSRQARSPDPSRPFPKWDTPAASGSLLSIAQVQPRWGH